MYDDDNRVTALHLAVNGDRIEAAILLLELGAKLDLTGTLSKLSGTPADWARKKGVVWIDIMEGMIFI